MPADGWQLPDVGPQLAVTIVVAGASGDLAKARRLQKAGDYAPPLHPPHNLFCLCLTLQKKTYPALFALFVKNFLPDVLQVGLPSLWHGAAFTCGPELASRLCPARHEHTPCAQAVREP